MLTIQFDFRTPSNTCFTGLSLIEYDFQIPELTEISLFDCDHNESNSIHELGSIAFDDWLRQGPQVLFKWQRVHQAEFEDTSRVN